MPTTPLPPIALATEAHGTARAMVLALPACPEREALLSVLARQATALASMATARGRKLGTRIRDVLIEASGCPLIVVGVTERRVYGRRVRWLGLGEVVPGPLWCAALAVHRVATCPRAVARLAALDAMPPVAMRRAA